MLSFGRVTLQTAICAVRCRWEMVLDGSTQVRGLRTMIFASRRKTSVLDSASVWKSLVLILVLQSWSWQFVYKLLQQCGTSFRFRSWSFVVASWFTERSRALLKTYWLNCLKTWRLYWQIQELSALVLIAIPSSWSWSWGLRLVYVTGLTRFTLKWGNWCAGLSSSGTNDRPYGHADN